MHLQSLRMAGNRAHIWEISTVEQNYNHWLQRLFLSLACKQPNKSVEEYINRWNHQIHNEASLVRIRVTFGQKFRKL